MQRGLSRDPAGDYCQAMNMDSGSAAARRGRGSRGLAVALAALAVIAIGLLACGDDDAKKATVPTPLAITTSDVEDERFRTEAPRSVKGGLVELTFTNAGKVGHEAQLARYDDGHTAADALDVILSEEPGIPSWFHAAGGAGSTRPGQTVKTTMNLAAGNYVMADNDNQEGRSNAKRGAFVEFEVTDGDDGSLPASTATITAATDEQAEPQHSFEITGLKVGKNRLRLVSEGEEVHHAIMLPIVPGNSLADVEEFFSDEGQASASPPVDFEGGAGTAAIDGDTEQVTDLVLPRVGRYAVICFLTDRDGKEPQPHLANGMLEEVEVR